MRLVNIAARLEVDGGELSNGSNRAKVRGWLKVRWLAKVRGVSVANIEVPTIWFLTLFPLHVCAGDPYPYP